MGLVFLASTFFSSKRIFSLFPSAFPVQQHAYYTRLYSFKFNWRIVSFTAAKTKRMFSVSEKIININISFGWVFWGIYKANVLQGRPV